MTETLLNLAIAHSSGFVLTALVICLVAGWLVATLMRYVAEAPAGTRRPWILGTAVVAGLGVWTTHFIAMLGYRPDLMLGYSGGTTTLSAVVAVLAVGMPLSVSAGASTRWGRAVLGGMAGSGIAAMHYCGMAAIEGCLQMHSSAMVVLAVAVGALGLGLACVLPTQLASRPVICAMFTLAVCGAHFTGIAGTVLEHLGGEAGFPHENVTLSIFTAGGAAVLFLGAFLSILAARRFDAQAQAHSAVLSTALDNMSNGLILLDKDRHLGLFNRRFLDLCKLPPDALRPGMNGREFVDVLTAANGWDAERRALIETLIERWAAMADDETGGRARRRSNALPPVLSPASGQRRSGAPHPSMGASLRASRRWRRRRPHPPHGRGRASRTCRSACGPLHATGSTRRCRPRTPRQFAAPRRSTPQAREPKRGWVGKRRPSLRGPARSRAAGRR